MNSLRFSLILAAIILLQSCGNKEEKVETETVAPQEVVNATPDPIEPEPTVNSVPEEPIEKYIPVPERFAFSNKGSFCVQVASGRLGKNVEEKVESWKNRGFQHTYVAIYSQDGSDEVWYRIRLGRFSKLNEAKAAAKAVAEEFNVEAWADNTKDEVPAQ